MIYSTAESWDIRAAIPHSPHIRFWTLSAQADDLSGGEFCLESVDRPCGTNVDQIQVFPNRVIKYL